MLSLDLSHFMTPAYAAALGLIVIQTGIGILFKAAQTGGKYAFSSASSVAISETLKFALSTVRFYRELRSRPNPSCNVTTNTTSEKLESGEKDESSRRNSESNESDETLLSDVEEQAVASDDDARLHLRDWKDFGDWRAFWQCYLAEVPLETRYGFAHLALLYVLINNLVFVLYRLSDPGTISLIKSGGTLITALVMYMCLGTKLVKGQWLSILLQVSGLIVTQYDPKNGSSYPLSTYSVLWFHTLLSAVSGVYNQTLCQGSKASLHANNMALYGPGAVTNVCYYFIIRILKPDEPGFFSGYTSIGALMVILSNVFIGLAMTAVYQYADAVIKCFATAISTGILLYLSYLIFGATFSALAIPGTAVVFISTYIYMDSTPPKDSTAASGSGKDAMNSGLEDNTDEENLLQSLTPNGHRRSLGFSITFTLSAMLIALLTLWNSHPPSNPSPSPKQGPLQSPFRNTLAIVRFEDQYETSVAPMVLQGYSPYFHSMHLSQGNWESDESNELNISHDYFDTNTAPYAPVAKIAQKLLEEPDSGIEGILFFKDTSWLRPLAFAEDTERMWLLDSPDGRCFSGISAMGGMSNDDGANVAPRLAVQAANTAREMDTNYAINQNAWCSGWSDMFYLPRRFFKDFVFLGDIFASTSVPEHTAIPTIFHIIDNTYRRHPAMSLIELIGDCWNPKHAESEGGLAAEEVVWRRCGQGFDYENESVVIAHYDRLEEDAAGME
ncbi:hypothetical protein NA57DRAFT_55176 [Rhizodiscina lignyota]|uniref:UDP-galactose transporter n=1 Tax=Rhizodiscina lignyota TaxID=1504668 RepID=A0A9P4IN14_9PEZI|nr:hypothetical protein NA57DRAFT_55176 [Rhizodiscina lignyota]